MIIRIEDLAEGEEEEVILRCHNLSPDVLKLLARLKAGEAMLLGERAGSIHRIQAKDIYYIDTADDKVFLYGKANVYEARQKLYELEEQLEGVDFLRVSKSVILNLNKIVSISPAFSGRFEARLENDEKVVISRQYVPRLKEKLGIEGRW